MIQIKRVYDSKADHDGVRFLVERLWPRGVRKADLVIDDWLKDVAPSTELRRWFSHDQKKWQEFRRRYHADLKVNPDAWEPILKQARHHKVTLLYSSHDTDHNNAVVLCDYLNDKLAAQ